MPAAARTGYDNGLAAGIYILLQERRKNAV